MIILDDDPAIHGAWDSRLMPLIKQFPHLSIRHFTEGKEFLSYLDTLSEIEKNRLLLLSDYELIGQSQNGLQIIDKSKLLRTLLVTSHYANPELQAQAVKIGTLILPKQLASEIALVFSNSSGQETTSVVKGQSVSTVIVDDVTYFVEMLIKFLFGNKQQHVDHYKEPQALLDNIDKYNKQTIFLLDNSFTSSTVSGIDLAQQLYQQGYKNLYLLSGNKLDENRIPDYLTAVTKNSKGLSHIKEVVSQRQNLPLTQQYSDSNIELTQDKITSVELEPNNSTIKQQFSQGIQGFINRIVHDLATPLMIVSMNNADLQEELPALLGTDPKQHAESLNAATISIEDNVSKITALTDTLSGTFRNLIQEKLNPNGFVKCSIYNSINYVLEVLPPEKYKEVRWERADLFDFLGNEIASIQLISQLLKYIFDKSEDCTCQNVLIMQESYEKYNVVYIKQVTESSTVDEREPITASELGMEIVFAMQILEKFGGNLSCYTLPNQCLEFVLSFPEQF